MDTYYGHVEEGKLPTPAVTEDRPRRRVLRLSDRIELGVLALQYLLVARLVILAAGIGGTPFVSGFLSVTAFAVRPLYSLFPSIVVGRYTLEPASAFLLISLTFCMAVLSFVLDRIRMRRRLELVREPIPQS